MTKDDDKSKILPFADDVLVVNTNIKMCNFFLWLFVNFAIIITNAATLISGR